ncbi:DUF6157 family protein [Allonocardiopsis opalescens]|uniref:Uncharacterized protein n=1 Tax=Allonocardiopsis opalescens TaxID=1144618 RepID=A0A2T0QDE5_9ACTN|nr:DUF6157 family protein [Allonocardiopsis opalescens]PRY01912.1 hypothetical protein CLV72_101510 [Allonocardiopsis opalescens]
MDLNYYRTFIAVSDDCPAEAAAEPPVRAGRETVASVQYRMLAEHPAAYTQEDVLFESWLRRQPPSEEVPAEPTDAQRAALRDRFFSRSHACLRASPLPKTYGWGLLFDDEGRITLCPRESEEYARLLTGPDGIRVLKAMRSKRA